MTVRLHPYAHARLEERGATEEEIIPAVESGEWFPAKFGRVGFSVHPKTDAHPGLFRAPTVREGLLGRTPSQ